MQHDRERGFGRGSFFLPFVDKTKGQPGLAILTPPSRFCFSFSPGSSSRADGSTGPPGASTARMQNYALLCMVIRSYAPLCAVMRFYADLCSRMRSYGRIGGGGFLLRAFPFVFLFAQENRPARARGSALSRGDRDRSHFTAGCQRMKRRSSSVTARSMTSAKAVRTRIPAITVFMSKVVSAWRIR